MIENKMPAQTITLQWSKPIIHWYWGNITTRSSKIATAIFHAGRDTCIRRKGNTTWECYSGQTVLILELVMDDWLMEDLLTLCSGLPLWPENGERPVCVKELFIVASSKCEDLPEGEELAKLVDEQIEFPMNCQCRTCVFQECMHSLLVGDEVHYPKLAPT